MKKSIVFMLVLTLFISIPSSGYASTKDVTGEESIVSTELNDDKLKAKELNEVYLELFPEFADKLSKDYEKYLKHINKHNNDKTSNINHKDLKITKASKVVFQETRKLGEDEHTLTVYEDGSIIKSGFMGGSNFFEGWKDGTFQSGTGYASWTDRIAYLRTVFSRIEIVVSYTFVNNGSDYISSHKLGADSYNVYHPDYNIPIIKNFVDPTYSVFRENEIGSVPAELIYPVAMQTSLFVDPYTGQSIGIYSSIEFGIEVGNDSARRVTSTH